MAGQVRLPPEAGYPALARFLREHGVKHVFLVCGGSIRGLAFDSFFRLLPETAGIQVTRFSGFHPNPDWKEVEEAAGCFRGCDAVVAVGGGSAIDVAKCVRVFAGAGDVPFVAVPTTAGSGSEATRFAVVYRDGVKQSVEDAACKPSAVLLDPGVLRPLPLLQRKCTMLDALCHAVESFWARGASEESRGLSGEALRLLLASKDGYLANTDAGNAGMQQAAYVAGQAIDLAKTTAGHAMAYGLTKRYGIPHGYAAALCVSRLWPYMLSEAQSSGDAELLGILGELAEAFGCGGAQAASERFTALLDSMQLTRPEAAESDIPALCAGVNAERLGNHPSRLDAEAIALLYRQILL